ncbi:MAG: hypothetical protein U0797_06355 [Gemmataceae bacterium]
MRLTQKNAGQYEAEVKAEEAGSYFLTAQATRVRKVKDNDGCEHEVEEGLDSVRAGVTLPYSPEFAGSLVQHAAARPPPRDDRRPHLRGRRRSAERGRVGARFARPERSRSPLPFHHWLLFLAAGLLLCDVAVRRLAIDGTRGGGEGAQVVRGAARLPTAAAGPGGAVGRLRGSASRGLNAVSRAGISAMPGIVMTSPRPPRPTPVSQPTAARPEEQPDGLDDLLKAKKPRLGGAGGTVGGGP